MSQRVLQVLGLAALLTAGGLSVGVTPAYACHESTGWCCTDHTCCYFDDNVNQGCIEIE